MRLVLWLCILTGVAVVVSTSRNTAGHNADFAMGGLYPLAFVYLCVLGLTGLCSEIGDKVDEIAAANNVSEPFWQP